MNAAADLAAYWQESASWEADRIRQWREAARIWRWVAAAGWSCALGVAAALVVLMPLKRVEPYVIRVDNSTGIVDVVPQFDGRALPSQLVTRYLLSRYVSVCQRFNFAMAESDYTECGAFHSAQRNQLWYAQWKRSNPESPLNLYKDGTTVQARVTSVTFLKEADHDPGLAQVRYVRRVQPAGEGAEQLSHWIASIRFDYAQPAHDARQRSLNPLGFRIVDFHTEQEAGQ
ncbi:MAG TPA: type IV secretion system protein [Steroidobacteraceae bacterium]|jgi:type IV secretion system protein VirB8|nr:type IV secretion system protein [Steroidobacteraceae bacterium]